MCRRLTASRSSIGALLLSLLTACGGSDQSGRVIVLGLDGMDPGVVDLLLSEGKLPGFARLRQEGAYGRLQSSRPLLSPVIWTTIATGKHPDQHGIGHFTALDPGSGEPIPVTSDMRRVKALWNILSERDRESAVVGWWATWPAETVQGAIVSDHTCYHFLFPEGQRGLGGMAGLTHPPDLAEQIAPLVRRPRDVTLEEATRWIDVGPEEFDRPFDFENEVSHFRWALATAESYGEIGRKLWVDRDPDLLMVYVEATDSTSHLFGHLFRAEGLEGELAEQQRRFGRATEEMYLYADEIVQSYLKLLDDRTTLVVLSDHGFELGALQDDPSRTRDMRRVSERFHRKEGILYLYGHGVRPRARLQGATLVDVAPTLLALVGLPAAHDMPGRVLDEALDVPVPGPRVATWESDGAGVPAARDAEVDREVMERLRSLGYVGGGESSRSAGATGARSPQGERNIAAVLFEQGDYAQAAEQYARLVEESPDDASLRTSLAGALGAQGLYDEALEQLDAAGRIDPLHAEAYHNRGVILERQGRARAALAQYRTALRYSPDYQPSRRALARLTGSATVNAPGNEAERQASALCGAASEAARRGAYAEAMRLIDAAEQAAPGYVVVYQHRSNVAYLMGDTQAAIAALEKALAIEPDNALFQHNLDSLKSHSGADEP